MREVVLALILGVFLWGLYGCNEGSRDGAGAPRGEGVSGATSVPGDSSGEKGDQSKSSNDDGGQRGEDIKSLRPIPSITTRIEPEDADKSEKIQSRREKVMRGPKTGPRRQGDLELLDMQRQNGGWKPVDWSNANRCEVTREDGKSIRLKSLPGPNSKSGAMLTFRSPVNTGPYDVLQIEAKVTALANPGEKVKLAIGLQTDSYFEAPPQKVEKATYSRVTCDLGGESFKSAPDWEYENTLGDQRQVKQVYLLVYSQTPCTLKLKDITFRQRRNRENGEE